MTHLYFRLSEIPNIEAGSKFAFVHIFRAHARAPSVYPAFEGRVRTGHFGFLLKKTYNNLGLEESYVNRHERLKM